MGLTTSPVRSPEQRLEALSHAPSGTGFILSPVTSSVRPKA